MDAPARRVAAERVVDVVRGIGRHVVRFVRLGDALFALKELPQPSRAREYRLLTALEDEDVPSVEAVGVASSAAELEAMLITRYLEYALPYRVVLGRASVPAPEHSMSAGALRAARATPSRRRLLGRLLAVERALPTRRGRARPRISSTSRRARGTRPSDGQRQHDVDIAKENIAGELHDLEAELDKSVVDDPFEFAERVSEGYDAALGRADAPEEVFRRTRATGSRSGSAAERARLRRRGGGGRRRRRRGAARLQPKVVEPGHHRRRLLRADRPRRAGEPGAPAAQRHHAATRRTCSARPGAGRRMRPPRAAGSPKFRAVDRRDARRAARQPRSGGALPRAARASLVPLRARGQGRRHRAAIKDYVETVLRPAPNEILPE